MEKRKNPLLCKFDTPFEVPPFEAICPKDYIPAYTTAIKQHNKEITRITSNANPPTFSNTIEQLEKSGVLLHRINNIFTNIQLASTNNALNRIAEKMAPVLSAHQDEILQNSQLFEKIKTIYNSEEALTQEQKMTVKYYYTSFLRGGATLTDADKEKLKHINSEWAKLSFKFGENLLKETNSFKLIIDNENDLSGLPEEQKNIAAETAKDNNMPGKWIFTLHNSSIMPFLQYVENHKLREKIYKAYTSRCSHNNTNNNWQIISKIISLSVRKAHLLGFKNYASYVISNNVAQTTEEVYKLCNPIWKAALQKAREEAKELQDYIEKEGRHFKLAPWDWRFYSERLKNEKYKLNEIEISQYFPLEKVCEGVFYVSQKLYGITFREISDIPLPHPDDLAYEVKDNNGSHLGIIYLDYFTRSNKSNGAWMDCFRAQSKLLNESPVIINVCNFAKPTKEKPCLLTCDEVCTLFHEFGHALHGLLSNCTYPSIAGTNVPNDFVEFPSQFMENWALEPEILKIYARHWKNNEPIPQVLIDKLQKAKTFNQGFNTTEYMAAVFLDLSYYSLEQPTRINARKFEHDTLKSIGLIPEITVRYRSPYFEHIFNGGYEAGYYTYLWSEILDADAFSAFKEQKDIFDSRNAYLFRHYILSKGHSDNLMKLYNKFRGKDPDGKALLRRKGLLIQ